MIDYNFYIHNDIDTIKKHTFSYKLEVYIMQEDRIVFAGSVESAERFIKSNTGKYCEPTPVVKHMEHINSGYKYINGWWIKT